MSVEMSRAPVLPCGRLPLILPCLIGAALPLTTYSQEEGDRPLEEVVVTAQYREQGVQDVPIAISAFSSEQLASAGITDLTDISRLAPDFTAVNDVGFVRLSVRGVQSNANDEGGDQAMVFNIDGDYINRGNFINAAMFDLERVEVLRGPQGTLYGRNATAGAVNVIARKPSLEGFDASVSADVGDFNAQIYNGAINFGLGDRMAIRVAAMSAEHDGFTSHPNFDEDTNSQDTEAYRLGVLFKPSDAWSIYLAGEYAEEFLVPSYAAANANNPPFTADAPVPGTCSSPGWVTVATFTPGFGCAPHGTDFVSTIDRENYVNFAPWLGERNQDTTAYRGSIDYTGDSVAAIYRFAFRSSHWDGAQGLPNLMFYREEDNDTTSHELRFSSTASSGFFWQTGLFYYKDEVDGKGGLHLPFRQQADPRGFGIYLNTFYRPDFTSESKAAFGQIEVPFADKFTAVLGARYTQDDKSGTFYSFAGPPAFGTGGLDQLRPIEDANVVNPSESDHSETTWTAGVNYQPDADALHYAKISKGYKAGGFDSVGIYEPETNLAYEIGSKNQFGTSLFNIAAFYYDYDDLQASVLLDTARGGQIFNAGKAEIYGVEAEYELAITDNDTLRLTANYLSAEYKKFAPLEEAVQCVGGCNANTVPSDASGNTLPNAPEWILTLGYDHVWQVGAGTLTGSIFTRYKDDYYNSVFNYQDSQQDSYTQTDVSLEYVTGNGNWSVQAYGRNLENELPINYMNFISAGPTNDDFNWVFGAPRTYGLRVAYTF
jgi:iron complex outermembrane recepter protein